MPFERLVAERDGVTITAQAIGYGMWVGASDGTGEAATRVVYARDDDGARELVTAFEERLAVGGFTCERIDIPDDIDEP